MHSNINSNARVGSDEEYWMMILWKDKTNSSTDKNGNSELTLLFVKAEPRIESDSPLQVEMSLLLGNTTNGKS